MLPFLRLRDLLLTRKSSSTPDDFEIPLGLSPVEFERLKALTDLPEWAVYVKALDEVVKFHGEALLGASTDDSLHYHRGMVMGIRKSASLVDEIRKTEEAFLDDKRRRNSIRGRTDKRSVLFGTPGWSSTHNSDDSD